MLCNILTDHAIFLKSKISRLKQYPIICYKTQAYSVWFNLQMLNIWKTTEKFKIRYMSRVFVTTDVLGWTARIDKDFKETFFQKRHLNKAKEKLFHLRSGTKRSHRKMCSDVQSTSERGSSKPSRRRKGTVSACSFWQTSEVQMKMNSCPVDLVLLYKLKSRCKKRSDFSGDVFPP